MTTTTTAPELNIVYISEDGRPMVCDVINPATGAGQYGGKTLPEVQALHPNAQIMDDAAYWALHDVYYISAPIEITEAEYMDALECLPPVKWTNTPDGESFKMSERLSGYITGIYCRIGKRFFCFNDDIRTPHMAALGKCHAAFNL